MRIVFGRDATEHVALEFQYPPPPDWSPWLDVAVSIAVTGFRGSIRISLEAYDLAQFGVRLRKLYRELNGTAKLESREEQLAIEVSVDVRGGVTLKGRVYSHATYGNCLDFELALDQTYLVEPLAQLEQINAEPGALTGRGDR